MITIENLKNIIVEGTSITPMIETNSINVDGKIYKLNNATITSTILKESLATSLEVQKLPTRLRFTFISSTGVVQDIKITFNEKSMVEVL